MRKLIIPIILLVLFIFAAPCLAMDVPNLFDVKTRVPVDSEVDPWDLFFIKKNGELGCKWDIIDVFNCPQGDQDMHVVIINPGLESKINIVELVIGDGKLLTLGVLCSYSYMKNDEWYMFLYDFNTKRYVKYEGEDGHGGSFFGRNE